MTMEWRTHRAIDLDGMYFYSFILYHRGILRSRGLSQPASSVRWTLWTNEGDRPRIGSFTVARDSDYQ